MKYFQKRAIILKLIQSLKEKGSWCGETHIQKSFYFLQQLARVPTEFSFILYKFGPFSFDFRDELSAMRADYLLNVQPNTYPYGPSIGIEVDYSRIEEMAPKTLAKYKNEITFVTEKLGSKGVQDLECLATALFSIMERSELKNDKERAAYIHSIKPHVDETEALQSLNTVHQFIEEFNSIQSAQTVAK